MTFNKKDNWNAHCNNEYKNQFFCSSECKPSNKLLYFWVHEPQMKGFTTFGSFHPLYFSPADSPLADTSIRPTTPENNS